MGSRSKAEGTQNSLYASLSARIAAFSYRRSPIAHRPSSSLTKTVALRRAPSSEGRRCGRLLRAAMLKKRVLHDYRSVDRRGDGVAMAAR